MRFAILPDRVFTTRSETAQAGAVVVEDGRIVGVEPVARVDRLSQIRLPGTNAAARPD
jgi:predicted amidohydrolase YtcJ